MKRNTLIAITIALGFFCAALFIEILKLGGKL